MADSDDKLNETNADKDTGTDDASLADLLGSSDVAEAETPRRVEHRDDEPDSGMVNLADMVSRFSQPPTATPPPQTVATQALPQGPDVTPLGIEMTEPSQATQVPAAKRSQAPIYALIAVVVVAAAAVIVVLQQRGGSNKDVQETTLAVHVEQLKQAEAARLERMQTELEESKAKAKAAEQKAAEAKVAAEKAEEKAAAEKAAGDESTEAPPEAAAPKVKSSAKGTSKKSNVAKSAAPVKEKRKTSATSSKSSKTTEVAAAKDKPRGGNELDELLGGGGSKKADPKKQAKATDDGLPKRPSKAEVKTAMGPVVAKAKACARYSTGTVQLRMTVGSNGRVKLSKSMGSFANTTAGKCVEMIGRTAKFSKFKDPSFTFTYPVILK